MRWVLLGAVLVVAALGVYGLLAWRLWRQLSALGLELAGVGERFGQISSALESRPPAGPTPGPAPGQTRHDLF